MTFKATLAHPTSPPLIRPWALAFSRLARGSTAGEALAQHSLAALSGANSVRGATTEGAAPQPQAAAFGTRTLDVASVTGLCCVRFVLGAEGDLLSIYLSRNEYEGGSE
ncbi:hypothetical protein DL98DRAFT_588483 [Cadophora sp. DSE1049]|nr:hypothetical protein DL98DRAFT_588483 [Cadophora sp. DSE1049]